MDFQLILSKIIEFKWLIFAIGTALLWGTAELFYKKGAQPTEKYSHLKICVWVGVVMGLHAVFTLLTQDIHYNPINILIYLPVRQKRIAIKHTICLIDELEQLAVGALRAAVQEGDLEKGCFLSGQAAAMVKKEQPAAEIVKEIMEQAEPVLLGAAKWVK